MQPSGPLFSAPGFVDRRQEIAELMAALDRAAMPAGPGAIFYICGVGGLGKTALLRHFHQMVYDRPDILEIGVIDLQRTRYLQEPLILRTITARLQHSLQVRGQDPSTSFQAFDKAAAAYVARIARYGFPDPEILRQLEDAFLADYEQLASQWPILLCFDTFEHLHPDFPELEPFNFRRDRLLERWLVRLLAKLPRTVVLLAGRPMASQRVLLKERLTAPSNRLRVIDLLPFTLDDTREYLQHITAAQRIAVEADVLHDLTGGHPVLLAMAFSTALALASRGEVWAPTLPRDEQRQNRTLLQAAFIRHALEDLRNTRPEIVDLIAKAVALRLGLDIELLCLLDGDTPEQARERLLEFCKLPFARAIVNSDAAIIVGLHDEVHELLFNEFIDDEQIEHWQRTAIAHLSAELAALTITDDLDDIQHRHVLTNDLVFYRIALDPVDGLQQYRELVESAINQRDEMRDDQLQTVMLRFFDPATAWGRYYRHRLESAGAIYNELLCEEAIRWVGRRLRTELPRRNRYEEAKKLAEDVATQFAGILDARPLLASEHKRARLEANVYLESSADGRQAIERDFTAVLDRLGALLASDDASLVASRSQIEQQRARSLNMRGYNRRLQQYYGSAILDYQEAARIQIRLGRELAGARVQTLINLGFALSEQGQFDEAVDVLTAARDLALRDGADQQAATARNTLARALRYREPLKALREALTARPVFERRQSLRGRALCAIAEGLVRGEVARLYSFTEPEAAEHYRIGQKRFEEAMDLFDDRLPTEVARRVEARLGLGRLHRLRALALESEGNAAEAATTFAAAEKVFHEARVLAEGAQLVGSEQALVLIELAVVAHSCGRVAEAQELLDKAETHIPEAYKLRERVGIVESEQTQQARIYWLRMAEIAFQRALCCFKLEQDQEACEQLLGAFAFAHTFSRDARHVEIFRRLSLQPLLQVGYRDTRAIAALQQSSNFFAVRYRVRPEARAEMERVFRTALTHIELLRMEPT